MRLFSVLIDAMKYSPTTNSRVLLPRTQMLVTLVEMRDKEKILQAAWKERSIEFQGQVITISPDFSQKIQERRNW